MTNENDNSNNNHNPEAANTTPPTADTAVPSNTNPSITFSGKVVGTTTATFGQKLKDVLAAFSPNLDTDSMVFREAGTSKPVSLDRVIKGNLSVTVIEKASGG